MSLQKSLIQFCQLNLDHLSTHETQLIENILFIQVYEEMMQSYQKEQKPFLRMIKSEQKIDHLSIDAKVIQLILQDILRSGYYTLAGLAYYTNTPEDILFDLASGTNCHPTLAFSRQLFELHRDIKPEVYKALLRQVLDKQAA